jgi:hypothetical protein
VGVYINNELAGQEDFKVAFRVLKVLKELYSFVLTRLPLKRGEVVCPQTISELPCIITN